MLPEDEKLWAQFLNQLSAAAVEAIDDAIAEATGGRLPAQAKDRVNEILQTQFRFVLEDNQVDRHGRAAIDQILAVARSAAAEAFDLEPVVRASVWGAFWKFLMGLTDMGDAELRRRRSMRD